MIFRSTSRRTDESPKCTPERENHHLLLPNQHHYQEHQLNTPRLSSVIKRQWQCQLCHGLNESDIQICDDCGSNKINVYIPSASHFGC